MNTIRNTKLFNELKKENKVDGFYSSAVWAKAQELDGENLPSMAGGLDHVKFTPLSVYFYDRGCNGRDNSFVIRKAKANTK